MDEVTQFGVIAIGRSECDRLRRCLMSIFRSAPFENVDGASTYGSVDFARSIGARVVQLDLTMPFTAARTFSFPGIADMHHGRQGGMGALRRALGYPPLRQETRRAKRQARYFRQVENAIGWTAGFSLLGLTLSLAFGPVAVAIAPMVRAIQFARLSYIGVGIWGWDMLTGIFAEIVGIWRFAAANIGARKQGAIFCK